MARRPLAWIVLSLAFAGHGTVASAAAADGLPVLGVDAGPAGVVDATGRFRYVTLGAGAGTVVARVARSDGRVYHSAFLDQHLTIPAVALDGSAAALSNDASTLVLIRPRRAFPQARTRLTILDAQRFRVRETLTLRGDFSFDAISPDGQLLYLIEYLSRRDPTRYAVRAYDVEAGRLHPDPIIDPREPDEAMRGFPITRASSPDGRWAYTLYDGAGKHPFIHALDTTARTAACIDLDRLAGHRRLNRLRLGMSADGGRLAVIDRRQPLAFVDTRTFQVSAPTTKGEGKGRSLLALALFAAVAALLGAGLVSLAFRRRRRVATT
jgi:hypothetical protein